MTRTPPPVCSCDPVPTADAAGWALPRLAPEHRPVLAHARQLCLTRHSSEET